MPRDVTIGTSSSSSLPSFFLSAHNWSPDALGNSTVWLQRTCDFETLHYSPALELLVIGMFVFRFFSNRPQTERVGQFPSIII